MIRRVCALLVLSVLSVGCGGRASSGESSTDVTTLVRWMTGSFNSAYQAKTDSTYFHINLEMAPIWRSRDDGAWMYVEQVAVSALDRPYRQRVYHVSTRDDGSFASEVFSLAAPARFAGAWRTPEVFDALTPDSLSVREGCVVILRRRDDGSFAGSTVEDRCRSSLRGATYATSEVTVYAERIESWDRGFDDDGEQVWGATAGPYVFRKVLEPGRPH